MGKRKRFVERLLIGRSLKIHSGNFVRKPRNRKSILHRLNRTRTVKLWISLCDHIARFIPGQYDYFVVVSFFIMNNKGRVGYTENLRSLTPFFILKQRFIKALLDQD